MTRTYLGQVQNLDWASPSRIFATTVELLDSQPNYEHEVAIALDTRIKYQGVAPVVGGWGYASGVPGPVPPIVPPSINDEFTEIMLEFDGAEGSTTYYDTNKGGIPRKWKQVCGFGRITNKGEKFYSGALFLDGQTVITAPDANTFNLSVDNFTFRGWFFCDFPLGTERVLIAKTDEAVVLRSFWLCRTSAGRFQVGVGTTKAMDNMIMDRNNVRIIDRFGLSLVSRAGVITDVETYTLESTTVYSDTINPGWHGFVFVRQGTAINLRMDDLLEDSKVIGMEVVNKVLGPLTIGGYGPPRSGILQGNPWIGGFDRFALDIGIAR